MNSEKKIRIYKKIIEDVCREYNGAKELIANKAKELCLQKEISAEVMLRTQFRVSLFSLSF